MAKLNKKCLLVAKQALSEFTYDDLNEYANLVFEKMKSYPGGGIASVKKAMKEVNNIKMASFFQDCQTRANDISKYERRANEIKSKKITIRDQFIRRYTNLDGNVVSAQRTTRGLFFDKVFKPLTEQEAEYLRDSKNELEIAQAIDGKASSPESKKIAESINNYIKYRNIETVISDALPLENIQDDRFFRAIHDSNKLLRGGRSSIKSALSTMKYTTEKSKKLWKEFIVKHLDMKRTFLRTEAMGIDGNLDMKEVSKILDQVFDNIIHSKSDIFSKSEVVKDIEVIKKRKRMFFHWKNFESSIVYNKQYGRGNLFDALLADIHGSSNIVGLAKTLGSSPGHAYIDLKKIQMTNFKKEPREGIKNWFYGTDLYYRQISSIDQTAVSPTKAALGANIRSLSSMSKLVKVVPKSLGDNAYIAAFAKRWSVDYFHAYGTSLFNIFNLIPNEDRRYLAKLFKSTVDSQIGYTGRYLDSINMSELLNKFSTGFFRRVGLEAFDRGNKISIIHLISKHLGNMKDKSFSTLNNHIKLQFSKFNFSENEWELLRKKSKRGLFTVDNVDSVSEEEIKKLYDKSDKSVPLYQMRENLYQKVFSMFDVASQNAVLSPSEFEKAWCYLGNSPGTYVGEALRFFSQFKMYAISAADRVLVQGALDAHATNSKFAWATTMLIGTIPLTLMSNWFDDILNGLSMPDITKMNAREKILYLINIIEPNLGMFMNLLDPKNENSNLLWSVIKSPSLSFIGDALSSVLHLLWPDQDGRKKALNSFKAAANHMLPIQTLPFASPYFRQALGEKAYLQPGQKVIYGK